MSILIADDHAGMRQAVRRLLTRGGDFTVVAEVGDGRDLLPAYEQHNPDITLVDYRMPPTSGVVAAQELLLAHPDATVVFLSGDDSPPAVAAAERIGATGYLHKALSGPQLCAALRGVAFRPAGPFVRASPQVAAQRLEDTPATAEHRQAPGRPTGL